VGHIFTDTLHEPERAAIYFNQALEICREINDPYEEAWTLWGMGGLAMLIDDYPAALTRYAEAREIAEKIGATLQIGWDSYHAGDAWYNLGDYDQALDCYEKAQSILNTANHARGQIQVLISLGLVFTAMGRLEEAADYFEQAVRQAEERDDLGLMLKSYEAYSAYYWLLGDENNLANAVRLSNRIIKLAVKEHYYEHELLGHYLRGASLFELRKLPEAVKSSDHAVHQLEQLIYLESRQISVAEIYYAHSRIVTALGQVDTSRVYLQKAYAETIRKANLIADEQQRYAFLNNVPLNQEIMAASGR
jgi:hypothetical protein